MKKIVLLFAAGIAVPAILMILSLITPAAALLFLPVLFAFPAAFSMIQYEKTALLYGVTVSFLLYWLFSYFGIIFGLVSALFGMLAGKDIAEKKSVKSVLFKCGLGFTVLVLVSVALYNKLGDANTTAILFKLLNSATELSASLPERLSSFEAVSPEMAEMLKNEIIPMLAQLMEQIKVLLPALLFMFSAFFGYAVLWIIALLSVILRQKPRFVPHFSRFHCGTTTTWIYIITMFATFFTDQGSVMAYTMQNLHAIVSFIMTICAMSLIDFWMKRKHWKGILRVLALYGIWIGSTMPLVSIVLTLLAFFDARANIRGLED